MTEWPNDPDDFPRTTARCRRLDINIDYQLHRRGVSRWRIAAARWNRNFGSRPRIAPGDYLPLIDISCARHTSNRNLKFVAIVEGTMRNHEQSKYCNEQRANGQRTNERMRARLFWAGCLAASPFDWHKLLIQPVSYFMLSTVTAVYSVFMPAPVRQHSDIC